MNIFRQHRNPGNFPKKHVFSLFSNLNAPKEYQSMDNSELDQSPCAFRAHISFQSYEYNCTNINSLNSSTQNAIQCQLLVPRHYHRVRRTMCQTGRHRHKTEDNDIVASDIYSRNLSRCPHVNRSKELS
jgi:hypothetical protein